jgi:hypothetical protein
LIFAVDCHPEVYPRVAQACAMLSDRSEQVDKLSMTAWLNGPISKS